MSSLPRSSFWAKLDDDHQRWHPLLAHSADVAAVAKRLLSPDSVLPGRLARLIGSDQLDDALIRLLVFLAALHDLGKANHGFQERRYRNPRDRHAPHEGHVQVVLHSLAYSPFIETVEGVFRSVVPIDADLTPIFSAAIAHHGRPFSSAMLGNSGRGGLDRLWKCDSKSGRDPLAEIRRIGEYARRWSGIEASGPPEHISTDPRFTHLFAGIVTLADWIGSTEEAFHLAPEAEDDPDAYWERAQRQADDACRKIGVIAARPVVALAGGDVYERIFPEVFGASTGNRPTELQALAAEMPLPPPGSRILIEAATGSGKTEAALSLFARLRAAGRVGGLMFALPTRATAKAMRDRVEKALRGIYRDNPPGVTLAVGGENPQMQAADGVMGGKQNVHDEEEGEKKDALYAWASSHAKKFLAAEIVVGTVDQALLAALAVKHAHLRLAGLSRHLLVVDEVHSHDRYMLKVLQTLLDFHTASGGDAALMSATLSADARARLAGEEDDSSYDEAVAQPYPTLAVREPGGGWRDHVVDTSTANRSVHWRLSSQDDGLAEAVEAARAGARVCVLRNLVKDAQQTVVELVAGGEADLLWRPTVAGHIPPYHAKYAPADRRVLDDSVLAAFGKNGTADGGSILVATQVVEQSLDVDFDLLVTDLAPVEVVLQRIGRLHRHRSRDARRPTKYRTPTAIVLGPDEPFRPKREYRGDHGWGTVYRELPALEHTFRLISKRDTIRVPTQNRELIERVYHHSRFDALRGEEGWSPVLNEVEGRGLSHDLQARDCVLHFHETYDENASRYRDEASIRTRLGDDTIRVALDPPAPCWYATGMQAEHVDLRIEDVQRAGIDLKEPRVGPGNLDANDVMEYPIGDRVLRYEPSGWQWNS